MNKVKYWGCIALLSLVVFLAGSYEAGALPRGENWRKIETEHFTVIFPEQYRDASEYVGAMAESIRQRFSKFLGAPVKKRIDVIVTDHIDQADRLSVAALRSSASRRIVLLPGNPLSATALLGIPLKQWIGAQFIYQYARILRQQNRGSVDTALSYLLSPEESSGWMDGGIGLYLVLKMQDQVGRFPFLDMFMRIELLDKDPSNLGQQAVIGSKQWPGDLGAILYGYAFLLYLSERYGEERFLELTQGGSIQETYNKSLEELEQEWLDHLQSYYQEQMEQIRRRPLTAMTRLSDTGYFTGSPIFAPDGQSIYYIEDNPHKDRGLIRLQLSDRQTLRLTDGNLSGAFSVSPDGRILYFGKTDYYKIDYQYSDLYALDLATRKVKRLTKGERAFDPTPAPDGRSLVYAVTTDRGMSLKRLDLTTGERTVLLEPKALGTQIRRPAFSPDGLTLAFQRLTTDGAGDDIYLINADGGNLRPLVRTSANDSSPVWSKDGQYIFFNSDRSGVQNVFVYALTKNQVYQVSNVLTGVLHPSISPENGDIVVEGYSSRGTDIYLAKVPTEHWLPLDETSIQAPAGSEVLPPAAHSPESGYNSFNSSLLPRILPAFGTDEGGFQLGLVFSGADLLTRQEYSLQLLYGFESSNIEFDAAYRYNRFRTKFGLFAYDRSEKFGSFFNTPEGEEDYWQRQQGGGAVLEYPFYKSRKAEWLGALRYEYRKISDASDEFEDLIPQPDTGVLSDVAIELNWKRFNRYRYSISPESGFRGFIDYRLYDEALGGDYNIDALTGDLQVYLKTFFQHHVLSLRGSGGYSSGDSLTQGMYQLGGYLFEMESDVLSRPRFYLRGYDQGVFRGDQFVLGSAEYRFPLWYPERAMLEGLLYWNHIGMTLFGDAGDAWNEDLRSIEMKYGAGGELNMYVGYLYGKLPFDMALGGAYGFDDDDGKTQFYFRMRVGGL